MIPIFVFTAVIKMEGGTDHDLRVLDVVNENDETKEKREGNASDDGGVSDASIGKLF